MDSELAASASFVNSPFYGFPHFDVTTTGGAVKLKTEKIKDLSVDYAKKELPLLNCRKTGRNKNSLILIALKIVSLKQGLNLAKNANTHPPTCRTPHTLNIP